MARIASKGPVLVHFFDFSQLNGVRTLPYLIEWDRRYRDRGLVTFGVQSPRFGFGGEEDLVRDGLSRLGVGFPVMIDADHRLWADYGCEGWPSLFLWARGGALDWFHFGEGEYAATEMAIQAQLRGLAPEEEIDLPEPMEPVRATDAEGVGVVPPGAELHPAGERAWTRREDGDSFVVEYEAGGAHATVEGEGGLLIDLDGRPLEPVAVDGAGLYTLHEDGVHAAHRLEIAIEGEVAIWSVSFSAGLPTG